MKSEPKKPKKSPAKKGAKTSSVSAAAKLRARSTQTSARRIRVKTAPSSTAQIHNPSPIHATTGTSRPRLNIPPLLLEGDLPSVSQPIPSGPGTRYSLGRTSGESTQPVSGLGELPESYGTERLFLTARDPFWLYASWDLTREQRQKYNSLSADGHLIIRTFVNSISGDAIAETHVHPESKSWFVHTGRGGTQFVAEIGYRGRDGRWNNIATSGATVTPPDRLSEDVTVQFATLPPEVKLEQVIEAVRKVIPENVPLLESIQQLRADGYTALPEIFISAPQSKWTEEQTQALAKVVAIDEARRVWMGSLEITELVRRQLQQEVSSLAAAELARRERAAGGAVSSISSALSGMPKPRGFWFNVNAELVIYGATERDAKLQIGERMVRLRSDGTFSFRFALPDGEYDLPVAATAADGSETRSARLGFCRTTAYHGEVGMHPQEASLRKPSPENAARV